MLVPIAYDVRSFRVRWRFSRLGILASPSGPLSADAEDRAAVAPEQGRTDAGHPEQSRFVLGSGVGDSQ